MNRVIFVMAQGQGSRWHPQHERRSTGLPLPIYKQCLPVSGEALIARTCRLVAADCQVVAPVDLLAEHGLHGLTLADPGPGLLNGVIQVMDLNPMADEIVILLGDVLYSPRALEWLMDDVPLRFLSRLLPSKVSGKAAPELFGFRATGKALADLYRAMKRITRRDYGGGASTRLWSLWDNLVNPPTIDLNDYTDDIDSPEEYMAFWPAMVSAALEDV